VTHLSCRPGLDPLAVEIEDTVQGGELRGPVAPAGATGLLAVLRRERSGAAGPHQEGGEPSAAARGVPGEALRQTLEEVAAVGSLALRGAQAEARVAALEGEREEQQQFLSIAAHDLRTPLAAIRGYAQLLQRQAGPGAPAGQRNGLQTIVQQTDRLADLTEMVLDVARIQTRRLALQRVTADLGQVVREAARGLQGEPTGPALVLRLPEALPRVQGDLFRLNQIARALLEFALARTPDGAPVTVEVRQDAGPGTAPEGEARQGAQGAAQGDGGVTLLVQDAGPALPEGERQGLFSRLVRPAAEGMSATLGALRLFVARGAAEAHGGRAWAESPAAPETGGLRLAVWLPTTGATAPAGAAGGEG
jgi:signal transduction histidine kinase